MSRDFYNLWLGLPPNPLPPDHYTLLGLELFQYDPSLTEKLARLRFSRVKAYEDHPDRSQREGAQEVMSRIALAKTVLGHQATKREYDRQLVAEWMQVAEAGQVHAALHVTAGHKKVGRQQELRKDDVVRIGSSPTVGLSLAGKRMHPVHAVVRGAEGIWVVRSHGDSVVTINGRRHEEEMLSVGDAIELGGYRLRFHVKVGPRTSAMVAGKQVRLRLLHSADVDEPWMDALAGESVVVGSGESALWQLPGDDVEETHCQIEWTKEGWTVTDLSQGAGTRLNGVSVTHAKLTENDRVAVGQHTFGVEFTGK